MLFNIFIGMAEHPLKADASAPTAVGVILFMYIMKCKSQYTIVAFDTDDSYNECSRLLETVGGWNP
jgi:hypothetical protein